MSRRSYIIAATPRSGSFLLCEAIHRTGMAGYPQEYAVAEEVQTWRDYHRCSAHVQYFHQFVARGSTSNGIFGAKLMWTQVLGLCEDIRRYLYVREGSRHEVLCRLVGEVSYVALLRRDRLRQAISLVRAMQTNIWSRKRGELDSTPPVTYDRGAIEWALRKIDHEKASWDAHIRESGTIPLAIYYEDFGDDSREVVGQIVRWLGAGEPPVSAPRRSLVRQSDEITDEWVQRYLSELASTVPMLTDSES
jgi:LPS sulfotransferase NodH